MAITPTEALVSWYSSHEESTSIYLADLKIVTDSSAFTPEQKRTEAFGDRLLSYQRSNGGFPRGRFREALDHGQKLKNCFERNLGDTTLDNSATYEQVRDLAEAYASTKLPRFRHGCEAGIAYLLEAQYENGGWPQRYPNPSGYSRHITFNDDAMVGALDVLLDASRGAAPFGWIGEDLREQAAKSVQRGIQCILDCQILVGGERTAWGQQHDHISLEPRSARSFEPASICSHESVRIVEFLMSLDSPGADVVAAVEAAVAWLNGPARLTAGDQSPEMLERRFGEEKPEFLWSRLYEIGTNRPVFGDRDGKIYYSESEISEERKRGYSWYVLTPRSLEDSYPRWREKIGR